MRGIVGFSDYDSLFAPVLSEVQLMESYRGLLHPRGPWDSRGFTFSNYVDVLYLLLQGRGWSVLE
jgi:hypothetical protein